MICKVRQDGRAALSLLTPRPLRMAMHSIVLPPECLPALIVDLSERLRTCSCEPGKVTETSLAQRASFMDELDVPNAFVEHFGINAMYIESTRTRTALLKHA